MTSRSWLCPTEGPMGGSEGSENVTLALWMTAWDGLCHIEKPMGGLESGNAGDDRLGGLVLPKWKHQRESWRCWPWGFKWQVRVGFISIEESMVDLKDGSAGVWWSGEVGPASTEGPMEILEEVDTMAVTDRQKQALSYWRPNGRLGGRWHWV